MSKTVVGILGQYASYPTQTVTVDGDKHHTEDTLGGVDLKVF
jgi:hypothetical protein